MNDFVELLKKEFENSCELKAGDYPFPMSPEEGKIWQISRRDTLQWIIEMLPQELFE